MRQPSLQGSAEPEQLARLKELRRCPYGVTLLDDLRWLCQAAGPDGLEKFMRSTVRGSGVPGQRPWGLICGPIGRKLLSSYIENLRRGSAIPLCDPSAAAPQGGTGLLMRGGELIDA